MTSINIDVAELAKMVPTLPTIQLRTYYASKGVALKSGHSVVGVAPFFPMRDAHEAKMA